MTPAPHANISCVAIGARALMIAGPPGSGKSTLALALIDRGAKLVGDDGIGLEARGGELWAHPPPNIAGKLELRGVGLIDFPCVSARVHLQLALGDTAERLPGPLGQLEYLGISIPVLPFSSGDPLQALRAEYALARHGLP